MSKFSKQTVSKYAWMLLQMFITIKDPIKNPSGKDTISNPYFKNKYIGYQK